MDEKNYVKKDMLTALEKRLVDAREQILPAAANRKNSASKNTPEKRTQKRICYDNHYDKQLNLLNQMSSENAKFC